MITKVSEIPPLDTRNICKQHYDNQSVTRFVSVDQRDGLMTCTEATALVRLNIFAS